MLRVLTSNRAVSLQVVSADICKVANERGVRAVWHDRPMLVSEMRRGGDDALIVMAADPLNAAPWFLLARDCRHGGVRAAFYATVEGRLSRRFVKEWMREVDYVANSFYVRDKLAEAGLRVKGVVPHGVDLEAALKARQSRQLGASYMMKHGLDPSRHVVCLTVSNAHPRKGLAWLDRVIEEVERRDGSIRFLVVTEGRGEAYFKRHPSLVVASDFGRLPRQAVLSLMAAAHVLALPSLSEGFGLPVLEAMALGTPPVHPTLPPLMEFSTGFTVPVKEILYFDREAVGPSGIEYEQRLYDVGEYAEVLLYVVDLLRNRREAIVDWRAKAFDAARRLDINYVYAALLRLLGYGVKEASAAVAAPVAFDDIPPIPPPQPPLPSRAEEEVAAPAAEVEAAPAPAEVSAEGLAEAVVSHFREALGPTRALKPIRFAGGDWWIRRKVLDVLAASGCRALVEVFGGSGVISMFAPREVFKNIVYNDKDGLIVDFFRVLKERPGELQRRLSLMPVSRELHSKYVSMIASGEVEKLDPLERAAAVYYVANLGFFGMLGRHSVSFGVDVSRSPARLSLKKVVSLEEMAKRWMDVVIENRDFRELLERYDRDYVVFYCDPPHLDVGRVKRSDYYRLKFTEEDMRELLERLAKVKGRFVLKLPGDHLELDFVKRWVEEHKFKVVELERALMMSKVIGGQRPRHVTALVCNFEPKVEAGEQQAPGVPRGAGQAEAGLPREDAER